MGARRATFFFNFQEKGIRKRQSSAAARMHVAVYGSTSRWVHLRRFDMVIESPGLILTSLEEKSAASRSIGGNAESPCPDRNHGGDHVLATPRLSPKAELPKVFTAASEFCSCVKQQFPFVGLTRTDQLNMAVHRNKQLTNYHECSAIFLLFFGTLKCSIFSHAFG